MAKEKVLNKAGVEILKDEVGKMIPTSLPANGGNADKLSISSYKEITIAVSDWSSLSDGGYSCIKTLDNSMPYAHFLFEVKLSTDNAAAKLQIDNWNYVMNDGRIEQTTDEEGSTSAFTFFAFTTQPTVELTISIQGVSGE